MPDSNGINQGWGYNPGLGYNPAFPPAPKPTPSRPPMRPPAYNETPRPRGGSPADARRATKPIRDEQYNRRASTSPNWWAEGRGSMAQAPGYRRKVDNYLTAQSYQSQINALKKVSNAGQAEYFRALALQSMLDGMK